MQADYVAVYRDLYERHWWWRSRETFILDVIENLHEEGAREVILDVGCGDGLFFDDLQRFGSVEGIEPDPAAVSPTGKWKTRIATQPLDESFRPGKSYSLILFLDVLEHMRDPLPALRRAVELLRARGSIIVTVPAFPSLWTSHDELNRHYTRYSKTSFAELAHRAGAREVRSAYFFHWLAPVKMAQRVKERLLPTEPRVPNVPRPWLNRTLGGVSRLEQRTITRLPMPFGTSLLVVLTRQETS
jgi:SAM-dependent methyltransferase